MIDKNEKKILNIVRYAPPFFIIVVTLFVALFMTSEHRKNMKEEKQSIEKVYVQEERLRIESISNRVYTYLQNQEKSKTNKLKQEIKLHVDNAHSIAQSIYNKYKDQKTKEEITSLIKEALRSVRFLDGRGYFFIYEMKGKNILNAGFPKIENKDLWNYKDAKGTLLIQEMNKLLQTKNEVFYDWFWFKPGDKKTQYKKVGFFKKFEPYDWFIGTGEYLDDFTNILKENAVDHISKLRYKNGGYVFIFDMNGTIITTKHKEMIGLNSYTTKILEPFSKELDKFIKSKEVDGFIEYEVYVSQTDNLPKEKVSHLKKFDKWGWIVGSGFNLEDFNKIVQERQVTLENKYASYINKLIVINFIILVILLITSISISKYLEKIFINYKLSLKEKGETLLKVQKIAKIGDWKLDLKTMQAHWSDEVLEILELEERPKNIGPEFLKTIMHEDDWECFEESMANAIQNNVEHHCIYRVKVSNDNYKWIDCRGQLDKNKNTIIGSIQDITERKEIEEEKEQKEKLLYQQSKMAAMGEMLGNIAHQWRQPLSTISVAATGVKIQKEMNVLSDKDLNKTMDTINNSAQYLSQTIEDFRNFFNSKEDKSSSFRINEVIEKAFKLVDAQFSSRGINIVKDIKEIEISTLENELIQVLVNILNNAKDALEDIDVEKQERLIFVNSYIKDDELLIEIFDNANGIKEEIMDRVFEPYFTTKHKGQGTGIGLYMSQDIVTKLLDGKIELENRTFEYNNNRYIGACFTIKLKL